MSTRPTTGPFKTGPHCELCGDWECGHDPKLEQTTDLDTGKEVVYCYRCRKGQAEIAAANAANYRRILQEIGATWQQHNLLSTATDAERRAFVQRITSAWNRYAVPLLESKAPAISCCIADGCGRPYDANQPEPRDLRTLRPFALRYCPEHRAPVTPPQIIEEQPAPTPAQHRAPYTCPHCHVQAKKVVCARCTRDMCAECISYEGGRDVCGLCQDEMRASAKR